MFYIRRSCVLSTAVVCVFAAKDICGMFLVLAHPQALLLIEMTSQLFSPSVASSRKPVGLVVS